MTKNLIPVIAENLGVEIGEEFKLQGYLGSKYRLNEDKLEVNFGSEWLRSGLTINDLVNSKAIKLPYKPKYGEQYWTYTGKTWNVAEELWEDRAVDCVRKHCGIVFRTEAEAIAARPAKHKELTGQEWKE